MRTIRLFILAAVFTLTSVGCTTYSGPGSNIRKAAVYEAQDRAFRDNAF